MTKPRKKPGSSAPAADREWAEYGRRFRQMREDRGVTLRSLSRTAGVSPGVVSKFERGEVSPTFVTMHRLLDVLGLSMADFFGAVEPQRAPRTAQIFAAKGVKTASSVGETITWLLPVQPHLACQMFVEEIAPDTVRVEVETLTSDLVGYILEGELTLYVPAKKGAGWRMIVAKQGDAFYIPANTPHRAGNRSKTKTTRLIDLFLNPGKAAY